MSNAIMSSLMPTPCIDDAIDYTKFAGKSWQEKMDICNECNCCYLHQSRKPRFVLPTVQAYDYIDVMDTSNELWYRECECKCRFLARRMCEEDNYNIMCASPSPSDLPMPPQEWLKKEDADELSLLDWATDEALEYYWKSQVKACQYAIVHVC
jgi:hypothetical protein